MKKAKKHGVANNKNALKDIDENQVLMCAQRFWTYTEIAALIGCSSRTLKNRFSDVIEKGRENGKAKLRDLQLKSAMSGNVTMQIWLGKQYLDQQDKTQIANLSEHELETLRQIAVNESSNSL